MKKVIISRFIRDESGRIIGKYILRTITVHHSFIGNGKFGHINKSSFHDLASDLEPTMENFEVMNA